MCSFLNENTIYFGDEISLEKRKCGILGIKATEKTVGSQRSVADFVVHLT